MGRHSSAHSPYPHHHSKMFWEEVLLPRERTFSPKGPNFLLNSFVAGGPFLGQSCENRLCSGHGFAGTGVERPPLAHDGAHCLFHGG